MKILAACLPFVCITSVSAITIKVDYTYDTNNFFNTAEKRAAMEAVANFFGGLINDNLLEINQTAFGNQSSWTARFTHPGTGSEQQIPGLVVPADTLIIYAGGRPLAGATVGQGGPGGFIANGFQPWFDRIRGRGNAGALAAPETDFAPWGGAVTFDNDVDRTWNFSLTTNGAGTEFVTIALHEIGHVLGIGTSEVWNELTSTNFFVGSAATQSEGSSPPAYNGHLQNPMPGSLDSPLFGSFQVTHGLVRPALMLPSTTDNGSNFDVATDLDLSVLLDLGWEVLPPPVLNVITLTPSSASFQWPSTSFLDHRVERGVNLVTFPDGNTLAAGNGVIQSWVDPAPPATRAFYRLYSEINIPALAPIIPLGVAKSGATSTNEFTTIRVDPVMIDCEFHDHTGCDHPHE